MRGLLRFGRPSPDYTRSDAYSVVLRLPTADADVEFLRLVLDEEGKRQGPLPIDSLIALSTLREHRQLGRAELAQIIHKNDKTALATLQRLVETGLVEAHGTGRGRTYNLAAQVYERQGLMAAYTRQAGFDRLQQEQLVLGFTRQHGEIRRSDVMELCHLGKDQASRLLRSMVGEGLLLAHGDRRWRFYTESTNENG
jgi:ATP-dependent DNA helicase RecG